MASTRIAQTTLSTIKTRSASNDTTGNGNDVPGSSGALENFRLFQFHIMQDREKPPMIVIEIQKVPDGRDPRQTFSNQYEFATEETHKSEQVPGMIDRIVDLEKSVYPTSINFLRAVVHNCDRYGRPIKGQFRSFPLDGTGTFAVPAGDEVAPANVVAVIEKVPTEGRSGKLLYRHALTSREFDEYSRNGTIPPRFRSVSAEGVVAGLIALLKALLDNNLFRLVIRKRFGIGGVIAAEILEKFLPEDVEDFRFSGFSFNQPSRKRTSGQDKEKKAAQQKINDLARQARYVEEGDQNGILPDRGDQVVAGLKAKALNIYNALPVELQARIVWPQIFDNNPLTGGV